MALAERSKKEYIQRVLRVQDYIEGHLDEELTLEQLAEVACFSPYHFHRIYRSLCGENLGQFILRIRLQKAASLLLSNTEEPILNIALDCGFSGAAVFARAFQKFYGMSASRWRKGGGLRYSEEKSKNRKALSKIGKASANGTPYPDTVQTAQEKNSIRRQKMNKTENKQAKEVRIVDDQPMTLAYVRHTGPYAGDAELFQKLFGKLCGWAGPRGFLNGDVKMLSIYHDNPELVEDDKLRMSICCTIPEGTEADGEIGVMKMEAGKNAHAEFELTDTEFGAAWNWVCGQWLPESGWQFDDRPTYELYLNDPAQHPEGKHHVEIVIPVRPL